MCHSFEYQHDFGYRRNYSSGTRWQLSSQNQVINSWIIYATSHRPRPKSLSLGHLEFRLEISTALLMGNVLIRKQSDLQPSTQGVGMSDLQHGLIRMVGNKHACHWCMKNNQFGKRNRAHETVYRCNSAKKDCKGECFAKFYNSLTLPSHA
ncbi:piggyBac transposable element-derived protein 3 [Biomphalaria pfeifferi]|uniref:PiggyBac transposable element-derived protein 3 n=1 Tax=Biomphalaria pfeifferi TaxID=112525 RepID=A0AAD8AW55_BIOPF|nr:piggyBac transposable element-derived protein 3 [Biomphalaria pfeifferi]